MLNLPVLYVVVARTKIHISSILLLRCACCQCSKWLQNIFHGREVIDFDVWLCITLWFLLAKCIHENWCKRLFILHFTARSKLIPHSHLQPTYRINNKKVRLLHCWDDDEWSLIVYLFCYRCIALQLLIIVRARDLSIWKLFTLASKQWIHIPI